MPAKIPVQPSQELRYHRTPVRWNVVGVQCLHNQIIVPILVLEYDVTLTVLEAHRNHQYCAVRLNIGREVVAGEEFVDTAEDWGHRKSLNF
jgi:hypothetical protein